jgi:hypothetical protein
LDLTPPKEGFSQCEEEAQEEEEGKQIKSCELASPQSREERRKSHHKNKTLSSKMHAWPEDEKDHGLPPTEEESIISVSSSSSAASDYY